MVELLLVALALYSLFLVVLIPGRPKRWTLFRRARMCDIDGGGCVRYRPNRSQPRREFHSIELHGADHSGVFPCGVLFMVES